MIAGLKEVKATMIKEDPHYMFDLYDVNKDGCLDVEEFNNLLIGCCPSKQMDRDVRKAVLKRLLGRVAQNKITKKQLLGIFGLEHIPKRITLPAP
jgi:Ca2+-binding EF-hand superfamily protein